MSEFYKRLDEAEQANRVKRIFSDRPDNLHDYQGCANDLARQNAAESLPAQPEQEICKCGHGHWNKQGGCSCCPCKEYKPVESLPVEAKEKEQRAANIPCYEVYDAKDIDCTVFQHERMNDLQDFVYQLLDGLEDGESIRIEFRNYMQEELDEVYNEL